ncbi:IS1634 family transposase [Methanospirillum stamsii]
MSIVDDSNVTIAHLGIVSGIIDKLGICEYIDRVIPKKRSHNVTHGQSVKALLLNCLGFTERRLYLMPEYFDDVATERLIGEGIESKHLNQYLFGETLEAIAAAGPTELFTGIVLEILDNLLHGVLRLHYDTTTISVTGEYDRDLNTRLIKLVRGHSKDHRNDLKQFVLSLVTDQRGIPVFMEPLSGNISDKKTLIRTIQEVRKNLNTEQTIYHMADSALYSAKMVQELSSHCYWITHVPETIKEVKNILKSDVEWIPCLDARYKYAAFDSKYGGIEQKWFLFHSEERHKSSIKRDIEKLEEKLAKSQTALNKSLVNGFACENDARLAVERWMSKHKRYILSDIEITSDNKKASGKVGRPKKGEVLEKWYSVSCKLSLNKEVIQKEQAVMGRFVLASNDTTIDPNTCLEYYKEQITVERGFRFIKGNSFHASEVYLENSNRIAALSMIMVLCLLVYSFTEWVIRETLKIEKKQIRDQKGKPTHKPSAKWLFFMFRRVRQIKEIDNSRILVRILNFTDELRDIVRLLGPHVEKYYV